MLVASTDPACVGNTRLVHATGFLTTPNLAQVKTRIFEMRYLAGILAGLHMGAPGTNGSKTVGYLAAFPIDEVFRGINAFALGCRSVNAECNVKVVWTGTWHGPWIEHAAATKLWVQDNARIVCQHSDTTDPQFVFAKNGPPKCSDLPMSSETGRTAFCMNAAEAEEAARYPEQGAGIGCARHLRTRAAARPGVLPTRDVLRAQRCGDAYSARGHPPIMRRRSHRHARLRRRLRSHVCADHVARCDWLLSRQDV